MLFIFHIPHTSKKQKKLEESTFPLTENWWNSAKILNIYAIFSPLHLLPSFLNENNDATTPRYSTLFTMPYLLVAHYHETDSIQCEDSWFLKQIRALLRSIQVNWLRR